MLVVLQLLDPDVYTPAYRMIRQQKSGSDIVSDVHEKLWKAMMLNHVPSVRQYVELFALKFILKFPDTTISDPQFFKTLLDPRQPKLPVASSMLMVVGFILTSELNSEQAVAFKKKIFESFLGFATSNSAHSRCIVHYFLAKLQEDTQYGAAFMPSGIQPIIEYIVESKDIKRMFKKYQADIEPFRQLVYSECNTDIILSTKLDIAGEYIGSPLVERLRQITTEVISAERDREFIPVERQDYWKNEL